jgi:hypothetical protein
MYKYPALLDGFVDHLALQNFKPNPRHPEKNENIYMRDIKYINYINSGNPLVASVSRFFIFFTQKHIKTY